jgi:aminobenzoyl-glutamate utilization protein B
VRKIAEGAALMTETRVETKVVSAVSNLLGNGPLEEAMEAEMERLGAAVPSTRRTGPSPARSRRR